MSELRRSFAMSHLPYSYETAGSLIKPFVLGADDTTGDNIADRAAWSETRGHYWLWKNEKFADDEFVSLQQYRRCFWFSPLMRGAPEWMSGFVAMANRNLGQQILHMSRKQYIDYVRFVDTADLEPLNYWLRDLDIVVSRPLQYPYSIGRVYGEHHRAQDWEIFAHVCRKNGLDDGRHCWLTGHLMFIMRPALFDEYMTLWWKVMSEVDGLLVHENDPYQHRKIGYLTERFVSAWLVKMRTERPTLRIQTLPIAEGLFQFDRQPGCM
jgi:hypothetical protein